MTPDVAATASAAAPTVCWQCAAPAGPALFCARCGALQPFADGTDYFTALGVARAPALDRAALDRRYYELSRQLHPDRYQTSAPPAQAASAANTALVNRAYRTLRDPVERGRYWLQLRGVGADARQTRVPPDLAAVVFEVQEQLEQLRQASPERRAPLRRAVEQMGPRLADAEARRLEQLAANFAQWQTAGDADGDGLATALARILADIAYVRALRRDIDKTLDT